MGWQRTSTMAVVVAEEQLPDAIEFYRQAFDMTVSERSALAARLTGAGFTIWLHVGAPTGTVLQEFEVCDVANPAKQLRELGCEIVRSSEEAAGSGFLVKDPYGMTFHVV